MINNPQFDVDYPKGKTSVCPSIKFSVINLENYGNRALKSITWALVSRLEQS